MKKIQYNGSSKILKGLAGKVNAIIDKLIVDVKVNGTSVVVVNEDGEREADIDLSLADQNVKQSPTTSSDNSDYRVLLSKSANDTEETDISRKDTNFKYNPSTGNLQTTKLNGNTVPSGSGNDTLAKLSDIPDMTNYVQKSLTVGLIKNDGTIDQTQYATMSDIPDELADLADDQTHRLVTDTDKTTWNDERLPYGILNTEDLNDLKTSAIYVGRSGNTCLNKPTDVQQFSLLVLRTAYTSTQYCEQILITPRGYEWRRNCYQNTWSAWVMSEFTDNKVKQTQISSSDNNYPLLLAYSANGTEETQYTWKDTNLTLNPSMKRFTYDGAIRGNIFEFYLHGVSVGSISYNSSNNSVVTLPASNGTLALQSDITSAINDLDVASTSIAASKTLATIKEEDGKVAVTTQDISIKSNQIENYCMVGTANAISSGVTWHKVASTTLTVANDDAIIMFAVQDAYIPDTDSASDSNGGILYCRVRQGSPVGTFSYGKLKFVANSGLDVNNFRLYYTITSGTSITYEIWTSMNRRYAFRKFVILSQSNRYQAATEKWTLYNSTSPTSAPTESATCVRVECEDNTYKQTDNDTLGATNLIPYPYSGGSNASRNNVTISVNENGVITASGNAPSSGFGYAVASRTETIVLDPSKSYIMSGMTNGSGSTVRFLLDLWTASQNPTTDSYTTRLYQATTETMIPSGYKYLQITLYFYTGAASLFPLTVSPMLRLASIVDSTFKPYADTNRNLSMNKADLSLIADTEKTSTASRAYAKNELMLFDGNLYRVKTAIASGDSITLNTNVVATTLSAEIKAIRDALNI